jgi:hypothetical protein
MLFVGEKSDAEIGVPGARIDKLLEVIYAEPAVD